MKHGRNAKLTNWIYIFKGAQMETLINSSRELQKCEHIKFSVSDGSSSVVTEVHRILSIVLFPSTFVQY